MQGQYDTSVRDRDFLRNLSESLQRMPSDVSVLIKLGRLYFEPFHDNINALLHLDRALAIEPRSVDALFWKAKILYHDYCDYEGAKRLLEDALAIDPNRPECLSLLVSVLGDLDESIEARLALLRRTIELAPDWIIPRIFLANLLIAQGNRAEAASFIMDSKKCVKSIETIADPLNSYFESSVTGRSWPNNKDELDRLLAQAVQGNRQ